METPEGMCRKLKPVIGSKADILWVSWLTEDFKGKKEIEELLQILCYKHFGKGQIEENILLVPPAKEQSRGEFYLGDVIYNDKPVRELYVTREQYLKQILLLGITGEGKTNTALILALNLLGKIPFMVVDWKRGWRNVLSLPNAEYPGLKDILVFTIGRNTAPFYWNPFRPPPNVHWKTWLMIITEALERSHLSGPGVADVFLKIYDRIFYEYGFSNGNSERYPNFYDGMKELANVKAYGRELLWKQSMSRILNSFTFGPHAICFNVRKPIKLEELLDKPVILELDQELPKPVRIFLSEIILRWIHLYRLSFTETDELAHTLFLEEAHNLFPKSKYEKENTSSLENVYRELRSRGQGLVSITQNPSQLPIFVFNCHTQIILGLQHDDDITASRKSLFLERDQDKYLDKLKVGEGIVKIKNRIDSCHVKFPLVQIKKGVITDEFIKKHMEGYSGYSKKHSDGTNSPKQGIPPVREISSGIGEIPSENEKRFLVDVLEYPFSGVIERYKRLGFSVRKGNEIKNTLIKKGFIKDGRITTRKGWILVLQPLKEGIRYLRDQGYKVLDCRDGIEHRFWKHRIAEYYKKRGYEVEIEKYVNGNADMIIKNNGKETAIEIETEKHRAVENVLKNLRHGCESVISVSINDSVASEIKNELKKAGLQENKRIVVTTTSDFE